MIENETYTRLIARCSEYGDCLLWGGCRTNTGYPQASVDGTKYLVRRLVFALCTGVEVPAGMAVTVKCGEKLCINHEHMALRTTQQVAKLAAKRGAFSKPDRCAAISRGCRKSANAKLTEEQAAEIRASTGPSQAVAEAYGVNRTTVQKIRSGKAWRAHAHGASVFTWAGGAA